MKLKKEKTYGKIKFSIKENSWIIEELEPHVAIKFKNIFERVGVTRTQPYKIKSSDDVCVDLLWFMSRYKLEISNQDKRVLNKGSKKYEEDKSALLKIYDSDYEPNPLMYDIVKEGFEFRKYQISAADYMKIKKRFILVDPIGSGKTFSAIAMGLKENTLPAAFVVQSHLPKQFYDKIECSTKLNVHIVKTKKPYKLPKADIYIFRYSVLNGWGEYFKQGYFKLAVFDEIQELRHGTDTSKGAGAKMLSMGVEYSVGTTATPFYGYGIEAFNIINIIDDGVLGTRAEFIREWCGGDEKRVKNSKALGAYLIDSGVMLRRTKRDLNINREGANIIIENVDYDPELIKSAEDLAKQLAIKTLSSDFHESGMASREFDIKMRQMTGIAKAKNVATFVRMLVESGEKVLLAGWHRAVYDIWQKELKDLGVVMYTGSESVKQKETNKELFINDKKINVMIISHSSGSGLDGIQYGCSTVVIGELDWSRKKHEQTIGRVDRDGQVEPVNAFIMVSEYGSDPVVSMLIGIKHNQVTGITDPNIVSEEINSDGSRLKLLARNYLNYMSVNQR